MVYGEQKGCGHGRDSLCHVYTIMNDCIHTTCHSDAGCHSNAGYLSNAGLLLGYPHGVATAVCVCSHGNGGCMRGTVSEGAAVACGRGGSFCEHSAPFHALCAMFSLWCVQGYLLAMANSMSVCKLRVNCPYPIREFRYTTEVVCIANMS